MAPKTLACRGCTQDCGEKPTKCLRRPVPFHRRHPLVAASKIRSLHITFTLAGRKSTNDHTKTGDDGAKGVLARDSLLRNFLAGWSVGVVGRRPHAGSRGGLRPTD